MQCQGPGSHSARGLLVTHGDILCPSEVSIRASPHNSWDHCQSSHHCYCACHHKLSPHYSAVVWLSGDLNCGPGLGNCRLSTTETHRYCSYSLCACSLVYQKPTLYSDVHCLFLHTIWACHPAGVLSVMVVSRHWVQ